MSLPENREKDFLELRRDVRDIKHTLDAGFYEQRSKFQARLLNTIDDDKRMMQVLLAVDSVKSASEIQKECGIKQYQCWRILDKLESEDIVFKLEETKKGSTVYSKSRWYRKLRFDDLVQEKLDSLVRSASIPEET